MCSDVKMFTLRILLLAWLSLVLAGCSDHSGGGAGTGASYQTISGVASKGPIAGANVTVWQLLANGQKGAKLGETISQNNGFYSVTIPATSGPILVEVRGNGTASYLDENNPAGPRLPFGAGDVFRAVIPDAAAGQAITATPFTEIVVQLATKPDGSINLDDIKKYSAALANLLGVDIVATVPNNVAVTQVSDINNGPDKYGAYLAGFQQQMTNEGKTIAAMIAAWVAKLSANQPLGDVGTGFLAAVDAVLADHAVNPTNITRLPEGASIQGAINTPLVLPNLADVTPPTAPAGLTAVLDNDKTVKLSWIASTDNIGVTGYTIFRNGDVVASVTAPATVYFDGTGVAFTRYTYTIKAFDSVHNMSAASNAADITIQPPPQPDMTLPTQPLGLASSLISSSSVALTWNASTDNVGVAGYTILRNGQKITTVAATGYVDATVAANTLYRYQVRAFDAAGNDSPASNELTVVTLPVPNAADQSAPTQPTGLSASSFGTNFVTLTWNPSTDNVGVAGYRIYRDTQLLDTVALPPYSDSTVAPNALYKYRVLAFDAAGNVSAMSVELSVTTKQVPNPPDTQAPTAPAGLISPNFTMNTVNLAWTASTDNDQVAGYNIYRDGAKIASVPQPGFSDATVTPATLYKYKVNAFDPTGNVSGFSNELTVTTLSDPAVVPPDTQAPTAPSSLFASAVTSSSLTLSWTASTDNVGVVKYDIYRDGNKITSVSSVGFTDAGGLAPNTSYKYKIQAFDAANNASPFSTELTAATVPSSDVLPPTAPSNLIASAVTSSSLTLSWTASTDNVGVVRYDVYRDGSKVGFVDGSIRTYPDAALSSDTLYRYKVQAFDAANNASPFSAELIVGTRSAPLTTPIDVNVGGQLDPGIVGSPSLDLSPPSAPTNLAATTFSTSATQSSIVLTWTAATDNVGVTGYDVYRGGTKIATVTQPGLTMTGAASGSTYTYLVIAFDAAGNRSPASNQLSVTPNVASLGVTVSGQLGSGITGLPSLDVAAPTAPANLAATTFSTSATQSSIVLTWSASTDNVGVAGYEVYGVAGVTSTKIATVTQPGLTVTGATSGSTYTYFVIAFDAAGNRSVASAQLSVTPNVASLGVTVSGQLGPGITGLPSLDQTPPSAPANLAATTFSTSATQSSIVLTWNASTDNVGVAGYEVYGVTGLTSTKIATVTQPGLTVTGATSGSTYTYFVIAFDAAGNRSVASSQLAVTPNVASLGVTVGGQLGSGITGLPSLDVAAPTAPANLAATTFATSATQSSIVLTWNASTDNVGVAGYEVYSVAGVTSTKIATVTQPGLTVTGATSGSTYTYFVIAFDAAGNRSVASSQLAVTPNIASLGVTVSGQLGSGITGLPSLDVAAPTAPANLAATTFSTSATQSSIVLTWSASTDNVGVAGYEVYSVTGVTSTKIATVTQPGLTVTGATSGSAYTYFVVAFDAAGNRSVASSQLAVTPNVASLGVTVGGQLGSGITGLPSLDVAAPTAPANLAATTFSTSATQSSIVLTWSASTDNVGVAGYEVYSVTGVTSTKIATVTQPGLTVTGATSGSAYTYFVIAFDAAGNRSVASAQLPVTPNVTSLGVTVSGQIDTGILGWLSLDVTAPSAPANLAATTFSTSVTQSSIVLTWNASTDNVGVAGYEVYSVTGVTSTKIATVTQPGLTVTGATSGSAYTYFVVAFDAAGNRSVASAQLPVTPNVASLGVTVSGQLSSALLELWNP